MEEKFCSVVLFNDRLFVTQQERVGGPRRVVFPPLELDPQVSDEVLGQAIETALERYVGQGPKVSPEEWKEDEARLLSFYGAKSSAALHRKGKDVTVRCDVKGDTMHLFGPRDEVVELRRPSTSVLGVEVRKLLC